MRKKDAQTDKYSNGSTDIQRARRRKISRKAQNEKKRAIFMMPAKMSRVKSRNEEDEEEDEHENEQWDEHENEQWDEHGYVIQIYGYCHHYDLIRF